MSVTGFLLRDLQRPSFVGDGVGYYAPLASMLVDGDLELRNELAHLNPRYVRAAFMTPDGRLGNPFPVGPAILWAPGVFAARFLPPHEGLDAPLPLRMRTTHPGFAPRFARVVQWTDMLLVLLGAGLLVAVLAKRAGPVLAAGTGLVCALGTPLFFYVLVDPSYGHAASFFAVSLLTSAALIDRQRRLPLELLGLLWGFVALVRSQDVLLGVLLAPRLLDEWRSRREDPPSSRARALLRFLLPALLGFAPQMLFWMRIYGTPLLVPPGPDFLPPWKPQVLPLLFSTWNGAFIWSPTLLVGLLGLFWVRDRSLRLAFAIALVLEVYSGSVIADWWGGRAFGARRLVSIAPIAMVGLAFLLQHLRRSRRMLAALVLALTLGCFWSLRLAEYQRRGLLPPNPGSHADYVRHHAPGSKHARPYGLWDYPRLLSEIVDAERMLRAETRRRDGRRF
ncbi:MAG: hypothetical protein ACE5G2_04240 [Candidatus Krumholzibacteriia bacterium]